jgi:WhiB family transcriptional regulator, redox-sensing transcriptional regulator
MTTGRLTLERASDEFAWSTRALCRTLSPAAFFASDRAAVEAAQRVCAGCPVRVECLEYALVNRLEHGVWGGLTARERRDIAATRRAS